MASRLSSLLQASHRLRRCFHRLPVTCVENHQRASEKLFVDAEQEEAKEARNPTPSISNLPQLQSQDEKLDRTADVKLGETPPNVHTDAYVVEQSAQTWQELANRPLLPSVEGHKPWHTTYKALSHASASIKLGNFTPASARAPAVHAMIGERTRKTERELARRKEKAGRLTRARESILDYRLGLKNGDGQRAARLNPVSMRGWQSLIEDKIQKARAAEHFDKIKGRGQPMVRLSDKHNSFIAREEFLMNRIVQWNGAAPPWVEVQIELETAVNSFRDVLRQSWTRRAIRTLMTLQPASTSPSLSLVSVTSLRDREWEEQERSYHVTAVAELNSLVGKYNALAPYSVRRPYYS
ncbi:hypothetical protein EDB19DRAFT_2030144 [Suillus lakei]|nr:hypothetical protein EDB19DRAFT_2030144 [Suillus lakei]